MNKAIKEINKPFKTILAMYNAAVAEMNRQDYKIYAPEDADFYIGGAVYNSDKDKIEVIWKEDNTHE